MRHKRFALLVCVASYQVNASAADGPKLNPQSTANKLDTFSIYAAGDLTVGANANVYGATLAKGSTTVGAGTIMSGNILSGTYTTVGAGANIAGTILTKDAATVGATGIVSGNLVSGAAVTVGANSSIAGALTALDAVTVGETAFVNGSILSGAATVIGANTSVGDSIQSGAAVTVGANSVIAGPIAAVGAVTVGAGAQTGTISGLATSPITFSPTAAIGTNLAGIDQELATAQANFTNLGLGTALDAVITSDFTLLPGVYSAGSLSFAAGTVLTLDGQNMNGAVFVFNLPDALTTGAASKITLINAGADPTIVWNIGSYASLGASSEFTGTILADGYITLGAKTVAVSSGMKCMGLYSTTSYVSIAANAVAGCMHLANYQEIDPQGNVSDARVSEIPEPATWAMMLIGFAMTGAAIRRRSSPAIVVTKILASDRMLIC